MTLDLVVSPCPNDTFIVHAWAHGLVAGAPPVALRLHDVDVANGMAARGDGDVLKISYGALPLVLDDYRLLPAGGALGRGCGPLVLARGGDTGRGIGGARIAVPGETTTAYLLLRLWARAVGEQPDDVVVMPFARIMPAVAAGEVDLGLVIHEARFTYADHGLEQVVDLGAWWEADTGLPIPLGAVVARRSLDPAPIVDALRASLDAAWADPAASADFVACHAQEMSADVQRRHIDTYVTRWSHTLGDDGLAAVEALLARAASLGVVPPVDTARLR